MAEVSTPVAKREVDRTPKVGVGAKALAEAAKNATVARVNFMVVVEDKVVLWFFI
jgi:hypothetical protein